MCGRYILDAPEDLSERYGIRQIRFDFEKSFNVAPSHLMPVIVEREPDLWEVKRLQWGLLPRWKSSGDSIPPQINARAETVAEKPMFRGLLPAKRCLIPASGFYEWQPGGTAKRKQPFLIHLPDEPLFSFAGLWDDARPDDAPEDMEGSFVIITTAANEKMAGLHHRMPVILKREDEETWISSELDEPQAVLPLLRQYDGERMEIYPVSPDVNSVRNNRPSLLEQEEEAPTQESLF